MADRYHYLPSIGLFVALVFRAGGLAAVRRIGRIALAAGVAAVLVIYASLTAVQVTRWRDSVTLFEHTLAVTPDNLVDPVQSWSRPRSAAKVSTKRVPISPKPCGSSRTSSTRLINMGMTLSEQGHPAEAVGFYERALRVAPDSSKAHTQLAIALAGQDKKTEALAEFRQALELAPQDADARANLGLMLARQGNVAEAMEQLNEAVRTQSRQRGGAQQSRTGSPRQWQSARKHPAFFHRAALETGPHRRPGKICGARKRGLVATSREALRVPGKFDQENRKAGKNSG